MASRCLLLSRRSDSFLSMKDETGIPMNIWKDTTSMAKAPYSGLPAATAASLVMIAAMVPPAMGEEALRAYSLVNSMLLTVKEISARPTRPIRAMATVFHSESNWEILIDVPRLTRSSGIINAVSMVGIPVDATESVGMMPVQYPAMYTTAAIIIPDIRPLVLYETTSPTANTIRNTVREKSGVHKFSIS